MNYLKNASFHSLLSCVKLASGRKFEEDCIVQPLPLPLARKVDDIGYDFDPDKIINYLSGLLVKLHQDVDFKKTIKFDVDDFFCQTNRDDMWFWIDNMFIIPMNLLSSKEVCVNNDYRDIINYYQALNEIAKDIDKDGVTHRIANIIINELILCHTKYTKLDKTKDITPKQFLDPGISIFRNDGIGYFQVSPVAIIEKLDKEYLCTENGNTYCKSEFQLKFTKNVIGCIKQVSDTQYMLDTMHSILPGFSICDIHMHKQNHDSVLCPRIVPNDTGNNISIFIDWEFGSESLIYTLQNGTLIFNITVEYEY